jgi:hypothetical protein
MLKNLYSAEAIAERQQSNLLNSINRIFNGEPPLQEVVMDSAAANEPIRDVASMSANIAAAVGNAGRMSPTSVSSHGTEDDGKARMKSPAKMMVEASFLSQQAALREADNFSEIWKLKQQEMELKREDMLSSRKQQEDEMTLSSMEKENHTKVLAKLVE